jgi:alkaline phosphatase D
VPVIGVWDDHDYGSNNADKYFEYKDLTRELYLDILDEPKDSLRRT